MAQRPWLVLKFGGTSVASSSRWECVISILKQRLQEGYRPVLVCSAISGVSNKLEQLTKNISKHNDVESVLETIEQKHLNLGRELGLEDTKAIIANEWEQLKRLAMGISLLRQSSPQVTAQIMSLGELMLSKMAHKWLQNQDLDIGFVDMRSHLKAVKQEGTSDCQHYLAAVCDHMPDKEFQQTLEATNHKAFITQGFIASDCKGDTVVLGRGGSDTSAAYIGTKLEAEQVEIWTDVPGMFTSDPREVPSAKLLLNLDYDEAQELATSGAKVLHPRCIDPLQSQGIKLRIGWTERPEFAGMSIAQEGAPSARVKAVIAKKDIHMISMDSLGMWHQVGFLADVFNCFRKHGLSIDLIATSQSNVTVTLDSISNVIEPQALEVLCDDLKQFCQPRLIGPVAAVSLVGKNIRSIIHEIGPALEAFEEKQIHLISQSASDLNFTFTVEEEDASRMVQKLHSLFFSETHDPEVFGPSWSDLFKKKDQDLDEKKAPWWKHESQQLLQIAEENSPCYVYHEPTLKAAASALDNKEVIARVNYAMKANSHPDILRLFYARGFGFDCVSLGEINYLLELFPQMDCSQILFTPNFAPINEYIEAFSLGCIVTLDNVDVAYAHPDVFKGKEVFLRVDPDVGKGHHKHVRTAGVQSKFGVSGSDIVGFKDFAQSIDLKVTGLHVHVGSGIRSPETWAENAVFLAELAKQFEHVKVLDLGGGLGVVEKPGQQALETEMVLASCQKVRKAYPDYELWLEPGRFLVAEAGIILSKVTQLKSKGDKNFVGVDVGMNSLLRPSLYGAYHEIVNLSKIDSELEMKADVVGPICETGDVVGYARSLPETREGDCMLVATAGAYGRVMASSYNQRQPAKEIYLSMPNGE
ncbi:MAG: bifunctional aspartate kinase/diaminopimelate decarboxylase [Oligoflexales bacterium]|nr:bifunctional aspartate kinase/diaminopimelate decarboxylase [Oligoflexales bacterium]